MYDFRDTTKTSTVPKKVIVDDALYLPKYSKTLDELLPLFQTIKVNGLNNFEKELEVQSGILNGDFLLSNRYPGKEIEVEFFINSRMQEELISTQRKIFGYLKDDNLEFSFQFLKDWKYKGIVKSIEYDPGTLTPKGKITFFCPNPFRFQSKKGELYKPLEGDMVRINRIEMMMTKDSATKGFLIYGSTSPILNRRAEIKILPRSTNYSTPKFELYFDDFRCLENGYSIAKYVSINSDIGTFYTTPAAGVRLNNTSFYTKSVIDYDVLEVG